MQKLEGDAYEWVCGTNQKPIVVGYEPVVCDDANDKQSIATAFLTLCENFKKAIDEVLAHPSMQSGVIRCYIEFLIPDVVDGKKFSKTTSFLSELVKLEETKWDYVFDDEISFVHGVSLFIDHQLKWPQERGALLYRRKFV